jgi:hypothetical protein
MPHKGDLSSGQILHRGVPSPELQGTYNIQICANIQSFFYSVVFLMIILSKNDAYMLHEIIAPTFFSKNTLKFANIMLFS